MATFCYVCKACGASTELDRLPKEGATTRHMVDGKVCGTFRRDWKADNVGVHTANLRRARR